MHTYAKNLIVVKTWALNHYYLLKTIKSVGFDLGLQAKTYGLDFSTWACWY